MEPLVPSAGGKEITVRAGRVRDAECALGGRGIACALHSPRSVQCVQSVHSAQCVPRNLMSSFQLIKNFRKFLKG